MAISDTTTRNTQCSSYATQCTHVAGHTAYPATSGNELTGTGSARGAITWTTPSGGSMTGTATITWPTAGGTVAALGLWSALTSGTFRDGQYDVTDITYGAGGGSATVNLSFTA